jgi:hypothetical protein
VVQERDAAFDAVGHGHFVETREQHLRETVLQLQVADPPHVVQALSTGYSSHGLATAPSTRDVVENCMRGSRKAVEGSQNTLLEPFGQANLQPNKGWLAVHHAFEVVARSPRAATKSLRGAEQGTEKRGGKGPADRAPERV